MALFSEMMEEQHRLSDRIKELNGENVQLWSLLAEAAELMSDLTGSTTTQSSMHLWARAIELRAKITALKTR